MYDHLLSRKVTDYTSMIVSDEYVYFLLYNLSGKIVGTQRYFPSGIKHMNSAAKKSSNPLKYKQEIAEGELGVFGLHTYDMNSKYLFIVEGVFDSIMLHNADLPALAMMTSDPKPYASWLRTLPQIKVVIADNDEGGKKLKKFGDIVYVCEGAKDLNAMTQSRLDEFIGGIKTELSL